MTRPGLAHPVRTIAYWFFTRSSHTRWLPARSPTGLAHPRPIPRYGRIYVCCSRLQSAAPLRGNAARAKKPFGPRSLRCEDLSKESE